MKTKTGVRLEDGVMPDRAGDYALVDGVWQAVTPNGLHGSLANHEVEVHEDGTITVSPSILVERGMTGMSWHGFLERGVWREA